jgi:helix-turn-helix protein
VDGEEHGASSAQPSGEPTRDFREDPGASGWTTTKQAAKVLGVSRRSVQGYVGRGLLEAREEGEGVNRRFLISIYSLNSLADRRLREVEETANFVDTSPESGEPANSFANTSEGLRHLIERLEARTAEATELRIRLELTERTQSTLEEELAEANRRREEAEQELAEQRHRVGEATEPSEDPQVGAEEPDRAASPVRCGGYSGGRRAATAAVLVA